MQGNPGLEQAYHRGLERLIPIFQDCLVENVTDRARAGQWWGALRSLRVLLQERPSLLPAVAKRAGLARPSPASD